MPAPRPPRARRGRSVVVWAAVALGPTAAEAQWARPIDWLVPCTALLESRLGSDHPVCDVAHAESGIKATLDGASLWLQKLGFASPAISANLDLAHHMSAAAGDLQGLQVASQRDPRCENRYCAWLVLGLGNKHGAYSWSDSSLVLDPFRMTEHGPEPGYDDGFGFAEVHELFHAVQAGYPHVEAAWDADYLRWILEGTAVHVALAAGEAAGLSVAQTVMLRTYDQPLHVPPTEDTSDPEFTSWAYGSWEFFDFLGDHLGSSDGVQYLDSLFSILRSGQKNGLEAVEALAGGPAEPGLYDAFPEFVAQRLLRPCYFSHLGEWHGRECVDRRDNEHRFALAFPDTVRREHTLSPLAANGYLVRMEVPDGELGVLTIRLPPGEDREDLHLVVDDHRHDETGPFGRRNEFTELLPAGRHEFLIRLVHAPRDLATIDVAPGLDFGAEDPAPIEFILDEFTSRVTYSGSITGSYTVPDQPPPGFSVFMADPHPNACTVVLNLPSRDGSDLVMVGGVLHPPLSTGRFPIEDVRSQGATRRSGGIMGLQAMPSCGLPGVDCGAGLPRLMPRGGAFEIIGLDGDVVIGRFRAPIGNGAIGGATSVVEGHFVAALTNVGGGRLTAAHPCRPQ